jgi:hydrogenase expression/formation protein HypC
MCLAIPGKITEIKKGSDDILLSGIIDFEGANREVNLSMVPDAKVGDYVLVHTGLAISVVDEEEAKATLDLFKQMEDFENEFPE